MTNIDRLDDLLFKIGTGTGGGYAELIDVAADVVSEVRRETAPQIIRTVAELKALDPDTVVAHSPDDMVTAEVLLDELRHFGWTPPLPAVVITPAEQVRAALKALEEAWTPYPS